MGINLILVVVGLVICFGGLYLRKVCAAFIGLLWGIIASAVFLLVTVGLWGMEESHLVVILVCGIIFAILGVVLEKFFVAINAFLTALVLSILLLTLLTAGGMEGIVLFIIAFIIALVASIFIFKIYDYYFIFMTAFNGAYLASTGACGLINGDDVAEVLMEVSYGGDAAGFIVIGTLVLGIAGMVVQIMRLKNRAEQ